MPDMHSLLSAALERIYFLEAHLELLELALEQIENSDNHFDRRASLLLNLYLSHAKNHFDQLSVELDRARQEVSNND